MVPLLLFEIGKTIFILDDYYLNLKIIKRIEDVDFQQKQFLVKRQTDMDNRLLNIFFSWKENLKKDISQRIRWEQF